MIPSAWIASRVTIFQVMQALGVYDGGDETTRQMLCPVHSDSRPSARVYADENRVHCFTCGAGWDVFALVMTIQRVDYRAAASWLMETFHLDAASAPDDVRAVLALPTGTVAPLFTHAEARVRSLRSQLSLTDYTKLTMALDIVAGQYRALQLDRAGVHRDITRILRRAEELRGITPSTGVPHAP